MTPPTGVAFRRRPLYKYTYVCIYVKGSSLLLAPAGRRGFAGDLLTVFRTDFHHTSSGCFSGAFSALLSAHTRCACFAALSPPFLASQSSKGNCGRILFSHCTELILRADLLP